MDRVAGALGTGTPLVSAATGNVWITPFFPAQQSHQIHPKLTTQDQ